MDFREVIKNDKTNWIFFKIVIAIVIFLILLLIIIGPNYIDKRIIQEQINFDTSLVQGNIVKIGYAMRNIEIITTKQKYIVNTRTSELNDFRIFSHTAEKGDSLYKPKYGDTLKLIKKDTKEEILYTFD